MKLRAQKHREGVGHARQSRKTIRECATKHAERGHVQQHEHKANQIEACQWSGAKCPQHNVHWPAELGYDQCADKCARHYAGKLKMVECGEVARPKLEQIVHGLHIERLLHLGVGRDGDQECAIRRSHNVPTKTDARGHSTRS